MKVMITINLTVEEFKERVVEEYDPDLLIEVLEINTEDLVQAFEQKLLDNRSKFEL